MESIKMALKNEAKVDKIEKFLNGNLDLETGILMRRDNLYTIVSMISKPHDADSK